MSDGGKGKTYGTKGCKEEEEVAVAVIAGVLREKFGPQIVREELEEWGNGIRGSEDEEGMGRLAAEELEEGEEEEEEEAEAEVSEEDAPPTTSPPTRPPPLTSPRVVSPSSLLSLYRFFSSHLGISSPSTVASILASKPQLLRSNPTNDFLPRVRLLQSYGISNADVAHVTLRYPAWLRSSLPRIQNTLEFLLSQGVRRSSLGLVGAEADSSNTGHLKQRLGRRHLCRLIVMFPIILGCSSHRIAENIAILQSFTPPGTPSVASSALRRAASILCLSKETLLAKLQFLVELVGEEATERVARSCSQVLQLSKENLQGKMALWVDLIGRENAARVVARSPLILCASEANMKNSFKELVREVEEALESSGKEGSGTIRLGGGELLVEEDESGVQGDKRCRARRLVVELVVKCPQAIQVSWEANLKHKLEYLKQEMGLTFAEVLAFPNYVTYSLDQRIRPRHVALVQMGYAVVAHEATSWRSVGDRRDISVGAGKQRSKLGSVCSSLSDEVEGVGGIDWGPESRKSESTDDRQEQQGEGEDGGIEVLLEECPGNHEPVGRAAAEQQLVNVEAARTMPIVAGAVGGPVLWALLFTLVSIKPGAGEETAGGVAELAGAAGAGGGGGGNSVSATAFLLGALLLLDGTGGDVAATAASPTAVSATAASATPATAVPVGGGGAGCSRGVAVQRAAAHGPAREARQHDPWDCRRPACWCEWAMAVLETGRRLRRELERRGAS
ncbi:unnamed protein product [Closterium sp. Naga37s-1]|nr:unnamed protein product [Closterium sp. Naga37s-1]